MTTKKRTLMVISPDGERKTEEYESNEDGEPPLETLQRLVGGYIELVPQSFRLHGVKARMYVNEEGLIRGLPLNQDATSLTGGIHRIVGPAVLIPE